MRERKSGELGSCGGGLGAVGIPTSGRWIASGAPRAVCKVLTNVETLRLASARCASVNNEPNPPQRTSAATNIPLAGSSAVPIVASQTMQNMVKYGYGSRTSPMISVPAPVSEVVASRTATIRGGLPRNLPATLKSLNPRGVTSVR